MTFSHPEGEDISAIKTRLLEEKANRFGLLVSDLSVADEEEALSMAVREWNTGLVSRGVDGVADSIRSFGSTNEVLKGFANGENFRRMLSERIPSKWALDRVGVYATMLEKGVWRKEVFRLDQQPKECVLDVILASSSIPCFFDSHKIGEKLYVDGGWEANGGDNVPIKPILDNHPEVKSVVVVYLSATKRLRVLQRDRIRTAAEQRGVRIVEVIPSKDIGGVSGVFDTSIETARRLIALGRKDAREALKAAGLTK